MAVLQRPDRTPAAALPRRGADRGRVPRAPRARPWRSSSPRRSRTRTPPPPAAAAAAEARERAAVAAAAEKAAEKAAARAEADAERRKRDAEEAARANREWIMRQYEEASDGDGSDGTGSDHDSLEDYGLTEEEIERKATARRRRRAFDADRDAHIAVMRREMDEARAEAAAGKVTRDKARQKRAGELVRRVKEEMAAYGLVDEDLHPAARRRRPRRRRRKSRTVWRAPPLEPLETLMGYLETRGTTRAHGEGEGSGPGAGADASRRAPDAGGGGGGDGGDGGGRRGRRAGAR